MRAHTEDFYRQGYKIMNEKKYFALAHDLFQEAYESQMHGELDTAIELYQRSIEAFPTAEAHTYLGWTYSFQGKLDEAIEECKKAISIDPGSHSMVAQGIPGQAL